MASFCPTAPKDSCASHRLRHPPHPASPQRTPNTHRFPGPRRSGGGGVCFPAGGHGLGTSMGGTPLSLSLRFWGLHPVTPVTQPDQTQEGGAGEWAEHRASLGAWGGLGGRRFSAFRGGVPACPCGRDEVGGPGVATVHFPGLRALLYCKKSDQAKGSGFGLGSRVQRCAGKSRAGAPPGGRSPQDPVRSVLSRKRDDFSRT